MAETVDLTYTEFKLLSLWRETGVESSPTIFSFPKSWGYDEVSELQSVHTYINRLRKKIENPAESSLHSQRTEDRLSVCVGGVKSKRNAEPYTWGDVLREGIIYTLC